MQRATTQQKAYQSFMRGYDRAKDIGGDPKTLPWFAAGRQHRCWPWHLLRPHRWSQMWPIMPRRGGGSRHKETWRDVGWGASQLNLAVEEAVMVPLVMHRHCWAAKGGGAISQRRGGLEEGRETEQLPWAWEDCTEHKQRRLHNPTWCSSFVCQPMLFGSKKLALAWSIILNLAWRFGKVVFNDSQNSLEIGSQMR